MDVMFLTEGILRRKICWDEKLGRTRNSEAGIEE